MPENYILTGRETIELTTMCGLTEYCRFDEIASIMQTTEDTYICFGTVFPRQVVKVTFTDGREKTYTSIRIMINHESVKLQIDRAQLLSILEGE